MAAPRQTIAEFAQQIGCTPAHAGRVIKRLEILTDADPSDKRRRYVPKVGSKAYQKLVAECSKNLQPVDRETATPTVQPIDGEIVEIQEGAMGQLIRVDFAAHNQDGAIAAIVDDVGLIFRESETNAQSFAADYLRRRRDAGRRLGAAGMQAMAAGIQEVEAQALRGQQQGKPAAAQTYCSPA